MSFNKPDFSRMLSEWETDFEKSQSQIQNFVNVSNLVRSQTMAYLAEMYTETGTGNSSGEASKPRGSVHGRKYKCRNREGGHAKLMVDYFIENPTFSDDDFRRRYRMHRRLFLRIMEDVQQANSYFQGGLDASRRNKFTLHQKVTVALRMLAYAMPADSLDETFHMGEQTVIDTLNEFCATVITLYRSEYLRGPTTQDLHRLLAKAERRGFPGMIGSLDCMHWTWKNCPTGWQGAYTGRSKKPTIVLEAVASHDTWIWHAFFGIPGAQNDVTVLNPSPLFDDLINGNTTTVAYVVNGHEHNITYYLADGIYPKWGTLIQVIRSPINLQEKLFSKMQESYHEDVERVFGILQSQFAIIKNPGRGWTTQHLSNIMITCVILHNMIVEDERDEYADEDSDDDETDPAISRRARARIYECGNAYMDNRSGNISLEDYMIRHRSIRSERLNKRLQDDLVKHVWSKRGRYE